MSEYHYRMEDLFDAELKGLEFGMELPPDEVIDASWEKVKARLINIRNAPGELNQPMKTTALESLDSSSLMSLYLDAIMLEATEDFLELLEEIMLNRTNRHPLMEAAFREYKARSSDKE